MIHITGNYYIDADEKQFILLKTRTYTKKDTREIKETQDVLGYHPSLESALQSLLSKQFKQEVHESQFELNDALNRYRELQNNLKELLATANENN